jgi:glutathione S-transferase
MTALPKLVSHHLCPYVQRAVIVAAEKGIAFEREYISLDAKPDWFLKLSPTGKVPVLQIGDTTLFESAVIAEYLDEAFPNRLHPDDALERARHRAWMEFASAILGDIAGLYSAVDAAAFEAKRQAMLARVVSLETQIAGPWFAGECFHMVDAFYGSVFRYFDVIEPFVPLGLFDATPKVSAWRQRLAERPSVANAVAADYAERLQAFLVAKNSHLSHLIGRASARAA